MVETQTTNKFRCEGCNRIYEDLDSALECEREDEEQTNIDRCEDFTITKDHLKLLKRMYVGWDDCEFGAPAIDCKRPYGNSDVLDDIKEITGKRSNILHKQMKVVLQIILCTGEIKEGRYKLKEKYDSRSWQFALQKGDEQ